MKNGGCCAKRRISKSKMLERAQSCILLSLCLDCGFTKTGYKKSIHPKDKLYKKLQKDLDSLDMPTTEGSVSSVLKENNDLLLSTTPAYIDSLESSSKEDSSTVSAAYVNKTLNALCDNTEGDADVDEEDLYCTCGIFLSSQFVKGSAEPPVDEPVSSTTTDRKFAFNAIDRKQCQTKCLEMIVQHLPNSANILCASLNRDIRKEKAYLFIRNCNSKWYNTNLTAGKEYCCKSGVPCKCGRK